MFISTWVLLVAGLVFALPMIHMRVQDSSWEMDELCVPLFAASVLFIAPFDPLPVPRRPAGCHLSETANPPYLALVASAIFALVPLMIDNRTTVQYRREQEKAQRLERA